MRCSSAKRIAGIGLLALAGILDSPGHADTVDASAEGQALGIGSYDVVIAETETVITVLDSTGVRLGTLSISPSPDRETASVMRYAEASGGALTVRWEWTPGAASLEAQWTEPSSRVPESARWVAVESDPPSWTQMEGVGDFFVRAQRIWAPFQAALNDTHVAPELPAGTRFRLEGQGVTGCFGSSAPAEGSPAPESPPTCLGAYVNGIGYDFNHAISCELAKAHAHTRCGVNAWCIGCCFVSSCNTTCLAGMGFCISTVAGRKCTAPNPPPPPPHPGPGGGNCCDRDGDGWVTGPECRLCCGGEVNHQRMTCET
jgi:hypothetical protein